MAKFGLSFMNFDPIPEGENVVLRIKKVDDAKFDSFGKAKVILEDKEGRTHIENFSLYMPDGKTENSIAAFLLSKLYMTAMDIDSIPEEDVELQDMVGHYIRCDITHEQVENPKKPGTFSIFSRLGKEKTHAECFDGEEKPAAEVKKEEPVKKQSPINLDDLLG